MAERASQPLNLGAARGPKKPVLPLPTEEELAEDAAAAEHAAAFSAPEPEDEWGKDEDSGYGGQTSAPDETATEDAESSPRMPEPYTPSMPEGGAYTAPAGEYGEDEGEGEEEEGGDDSAGGFASLMGTRINRETEAAGADESDEWQEDAGDYMGGYDAEEPAAGVGGATDEDALELTTEAGDTAGPEAQGPQDELLLDADRLAEADQPLQPAGGRRRRMLGGGGEDGPDQPAAAPAKPSGGSTLFERMANLSRAGTTSRRKKRKRARAKGPRRCAFRASSAARTTSRAIRPLFRLPYLGGPHGYRRTGPNGAHSPCAVHCCWPWRWSCRRQ